MAMQQTQTMRCSPRTVVTLTRDGAREVDRVAIEELGIPGAVLMENAAAALEEAALAMLAEDSSGAAAGVVTGKGGTVVIACGPGNNGGDGFALARRLHNRGLSVRVLQCVPTDQYKGEAATNLSIIRRMGLGVVELNGEDVAGSLRRVLEPAGRILMVVDALLGTGTTSAPRPPLDGIVRWLNRLGEAGAWVLSVDVPTGIDCDTGEALGKGEVVVDADWTVTLAAMKPGLGMGVGKRMAGRVTVGDIGVPGEVLRRLAE